MPFTWSTCCENVRHSTLDWKRIRQDAGNRCYEGAGAKYSCFINATEQRPAKGDDGVWTKLLRATLKDVLVYLQGDGNCVTKISYNK